MIRVILDYHGDFIELPPGESVLGRDLDCRIRFCDATVSRRHVRFMVDYQAALVEDLGSANGTLLNGHRLLGIRQMADGDEVRIGNRVLKVVLDASAGDRPDGPPPEATASDLPVPRSRAAQAPAPDDERRTSSRHPVEIPIVYASHNLLIEATGRDLSHGGMFVASELLEPVGTHCALSLVPGGAPPIRVQGRVCHVVDDTEEDPAGRPIGFGIEFVDLDAAAQRWLESFLGKVELSRP